LSNAVTRSLALKANMFSTLVSFLRSPYSPNPLAVVPLIILIIRYSNRSDLEMPLQGLKDLCKSILASAVNLHLRLNDKNVEIPKAMMMLVDLVVEIQNL
jgi:hypothetical protein